MSKNICPFCQQELSYMDTIDGGFEIFSCDCKKGIWFFGNDKLWQELIRIQELLEIEDAEHSMCHTQMLKTTEKLERTRKALDVAVDALDAGRTLARIAGFEMLATGMDEAVNKITALEQKDVK